MKQISWLSGLSATGSPASAAICRISSLRYSPTGRSRRLSSSLAQGEQDVGLVLALVCPGEQLEPAAVGTNAGVVTCGDVVGVQEHGSAEQEVELDLVVAGKARVGSAAPVVLLYEVIHHMLLELALEVQDVVWSADDLADPPGIVHVLDRAAALAEGREVVPLNGPQAHGDADDLVALIL